MSHTPTRRELLAGAAASTALIGCDRIVVDANSPQPQVATDPISGAQFIPPISSNEDFYVYACCGPQPVDPASWTCAIIDRGSQVAQLDLATLRSLPVAEVEHSLQCIGSSPRSPLIGNAVWEGVPLLEVLEHLGVAIHPSVVEILLEGTDGYYASVPIGDLQERIWAVHRMNGVDLPFEHGGPCRLLVSGRYGVKNLKYISRIELVDAPAENFWDAGGWSPTAEYQGNGFILSPELGTQVPVDEPVRILGTAFAGLDPIAKVEVTVDGGATYRPAKIDYSPGPNIWTLWSFEWTPRERGVATVQCRVTTQGGVVSEQDITAVTRLEGYNGGMAVQLSVV